MNDSDARFGPVVLSSVSLGTAPMRLSKKASGWRWPAALLVVVVLLCNYPLISGRTAPQWDAADFFGPSFSLISDHIRAHQLVTWNPWTNGGTPDFAEPELGVNSPVVLVTAAIFHHPRTGFVVYWMIIWVGAGWGMLRLTRHLQCPPWGGLIAALAFVTSGFFLNHAQHISSLYSMAFLPWICWRLDDALLTRRYWSAVQAGVLYGMSALGGYPQFTILTPGFLGLWVIGRVLFPEESDEVARAQPPAAPVRFVPALVSLVLVGAVGVLILSPSYLAIVTETKGYSDRIGERSRVEATSSNLLPAGAIATLASPYLSMLAYPGLPGRLWPESDVSMSNIYSGAVVTVLGLLALLRRSRWRWWLAFVAVVFLCSSMGSQLPVRGWIYDLIPPTRYFRNPSMFSSYSIFLLCIFAALTARDWSANDAMSRVERWRFMGLSLLAAISSAAVFVLLSSQVPNPPFEFGLAKVQLGITWAGLVLVGALMVGWRLTVKQYAQLLVALALVDAAMTLTVSQPVMYSDGTVQWWKMMGHKHNPSLDLTSHGLDRQLHVPRMFSGIEYPNNRNVAAKIPVLDSYTPFLNRYEIALDSDPKLTQFALGENRMWFVAKPVAAAPTNATLDRYAAKVRAGTGLVMVVHSPVQMSGIAAKSTLPANAPAEVQPVQANWDQAMIATPAPVELTDYKPTRLEFLYNAPQAGWLMVTDRWAPGWKAEVNGRPAEVYGANFLFRAVRVEAGANTIRFWYAPRTWNLAVMVSWFTLLIFAVVSLVRWVQRRPSASEV